MLELFILSFLITFLYTPYGYFIEKGSNLRTYSLQLIYGLIILSFFALLINFFFPLGIYINSVFLIISIFILIKFKKQYFSKKYIFFCFISSLILFLLLACSNVYRPDAGLYHLPYINILNNEKIIIGLSNLHFRFGHTSIIQYTSALSNNFLLKDNGINFPSALIASSVIINFVSNLNKRLKKKNFDLYFFVTLSFLIFIFYKINRFSEYGNDAPAHLLLFLLISEIVKYYDNYTIEKISNYFLLSIFIVMNKIILSVAVFFPLVLLLFQKNKIRFLNTYNISIFLFIIFWCIKNVLVSGCILYPVTLTCIKDLRWSNITETKKISLENEIWAKGWPDFRNKNNDKISKKDYLKISNWLRTWISNHFLKILEIIIPYLAFLILIIILTRESFKKFNINNYIKVYLLLSFVGIVLWLFKVPVFRYGYSYLIIFISLIFAIFLSKANLKKRSNIIFKYITVFSLLVFISKNLLRIFESEIYYNYPWPKIYSMKKGNNIEELGNKIINNKKIYYSEDGYCMYRLSPCGPKTDKLIIDKKKNYLFFFK